MAVFYKRNTNIYISKAANASANATNTVQLNVKDFSYNQNSRTVGVGRNTLDPSQARTPVPHIAAVTPVTFSFVTYVLPLVDTNVTSPEEYLWVSLMGVDTLTSNPTSSTIDFANGNVAELQNLTIWFKQPTQSEGNFRLDNCIIDNADFNFDINGIAEISWSGRALSITEDNIPLRSAVSLDGTAGTWVNMGDQPELDVGTGDFTLEFTFRGTNNSFIVGKYTGGLGYTTYLDGTGNLRVLINDGGTFAEFVSTEVLWDNAWHTVAASVNRTSDELIVTLDNVVQTPVDISLVTGTLSNVVTFRVGASNTGGAPLNGAVDEVRLWNDVRTPAEIADNRLLEIIDPALDASLVGYWKMNDATGIIAVDSSASGNNGDLAGNASFIIPATDRTTVTNYIKNRPSSITLNMNSVDYTLALTGGSIKFDNKNTFYGRSKLGQTTVPVGHYTGNREVTGSIDFYMRSGTNETVDLFNAILNNVTNTDYETTHEALITINIGGAATTPRVTFTLPQALLEIPRQDFGELYKISVPFKAKEQTGSYNTVIYTA